MIHKYPHAEMFDPTCERCRTMTLASLGPGWCESLTGMTPEELREWGFAHGEVLGMQVMDVPAIAAYYDSLKRIVR